MADEADLEDRKDHVERLLKAVEDYLGALIADTNMVSRSGQIERDMIEGYFSDLTGDLCRRLPECGGRGAGRPRGVRGRGGARDILLTPRAAGPPANSIHIQEITMPRPKGGYVNAAGEPIPGTHDPISRFMDPHRLYALALQQGEQGLPFNPHAAIDIGSAVHGMAELDLKGRSDREIEAYAQ